MRKLLLFFSLFFLFPGLIFANESVSGLTLCADENPLDNSFYQYIGSTLKTDPICGQTQLVIHNWTDCSINNPINNQVGIKIEEVVDDNKEVDVFFDTVFDWCKQPLLFSKLSPGSEDNYFVALLSEATFFYIRGTRYINIGNINTSSEFRKKLFQAYLDFLSNDPKISYPLLDRRNGDPWIKFQNGKYSNPPNVIGIIGNGFAMFANISDKTQSFTINDLSSVNNGYLYSNKKTSPIRYNSTSLALEKNEAIFITKKTDISPSPNIPSITPSSTSTPVHQLTPTLGPPTTVKTLTPTPISINTPTPIISDNKIIPVQKEYFQSNQSSLIDSFQYLIFSFVYIMLIHFAVGIKKEFNLFLMISGFVIGGVIGWWFKSWEIGLVLGVVFSMIFY